ncbi:putative bifunctional diguanylate cyclase/phosphodiesterase [Couchioplanes caeruleus]|uniref:Diguanylate cyclase n=2 Tax=Couchioplanes caeruleus TaxID=56438 RepID=A0A1K0FKN2_9ACTN|nr:bifunctional diguanylate cyclase/phosphodiesterase [Couchioplanes caeruleus]OJF13413.1 diguanylate cyclase [Couchioplanes caeruleus subsp. caeruleus]ROP32100.1 diguanylate cyclase (GGDEF)-like protein [Couchioplanes caeruleus]
MTSNGADAPRGGLSWRDPDARVLAIATVLATLVATVQALWARDQALFSPRESLILLILAALFACAERFVVVFPVRRGAHTISLSEIPLVLGLIWCAPAAIVLARILGGVVGLIAFRRQRGVKLLFNVTLYATEATVATAVFRLIAEPAQVLHPRGWLAAYAAMMVVDVVSIVLVTAVIALHDDSQEWRRLVTADIKELVQLPMVTVTTTLALIAAIVIRDQLLASILLAVLSYAIYQVFRRYAQQTQGHAQVEQLYDFTRSLNGSRDLDTVIDTVLSRVRDVTRADTAELVVTTGGGAPLRFRLSDQHRLPTRQHNGCDPSAWWYPALRGEPVLLPPGAPGERPPGTPGGRDRPADGMAVPVAMDRGTGVLMVYDSLADIPTFSGEHLRLLQALAAHAAVALTNIGLVDRLRHSSLHDALTGLPNRRMLLTDLKDAIESGISSGTVGVLLLDIDRFKEINDALGHDVGDDLLRQIAQRLQSSFADRGTVARLGGDEFAVIVDRCDSPQEALDAAEELRRIVEQPVPVGDMTITTQASVGVSFAPDHGIEPDRLLQRADVAMYAAKHARTGVRAYQAQDDLNTPRRLTLMAELRSAIEAGALTVAYQPKIDPEDGRVLGAEALARWLRPDGPVPPDEFIPLAERAGLIPALTRFILDTALAACADWRSGGRDLSVAVNLSPQILTEPGLADDVSDALRRYGLPPTALTLEITENGVMEDPARSVRTLELLHALGVKLSIDDFGTGHSSLGRLAELPIHEMKIDKSFVRGLTSDQTRRAVTDAALQLGRTLGLIVVAEGVEDESELEYLRRHGCSAIQGYYISRPLPTEQFAEWLSGRPTAHLPELEVRTADA